MTSRELVRAALDFAEYDEVPTERDDVTWPDIAFGTGLRGGEAADLAKADGMDGKRFRVDEWGSGWVALEDGVCGEVKYPALADWGRLDGYRPPYSMLAGIDASRADAGCAATDKFVVPLWGGAYNLFERMQHLRGTESLFYDLAYGDARAYRLRDMVHEFYMTQAQIIVATDVDGVHLTDDWGAQGSLLISPEMWRSFFKPCYREYCELAHRHGKYVIMHSDGYIAEILDDLAEIGVNAINAQIFCMDIEGLAARYHHRLAFWGEMDRQWALPHGTEGDCREAVRRVAGAFFRYGRTGLVGQVFWGKDIPGGNIDACYDEWKRV
ncbi:MAG: hypothetical protein FWE70_03845 [Oscillospiraceae bacterium]|nr:hypothetical protein [Oscillospiraceae bacterium]